jgi:hypothetical protein
MRQKLTQKLRDETITPDEAIKLKTILEKEKEQANAANDFLAILAIIGLLSLLAAVLLDDTKKKKKKSRK